MHGCYHAVRVSFAKLGAKLTLCVTISLSAKSGTFAMNLVKGNWVLGTPTLEELLGVIYSVSAGGVFGVSVQGQA